MKTIYILGTRGFPNIQGGVEKHCERLYPELASEYKITVFRRNAFLPKENRLSEYLGIHFIDLPSTRIKGFESVLHSFLSTIYCIFKRPNLVHIHNIGPGMFIPLLKLAGLKTVLTYHSPNYEHAKWGFISKLILRLSEKISLKWSDGIIFVNRIQLEKYDAKIREKSIYIPNGVHIRPKTKDTDFIKQIGVIPHQYILAVGRITQEKGFDYMIDAFLASNIDNIKMVIAGGIDHSSKYAKKIEHLSKNKNIVLAGYVDGNNLYQLYSHASLFILPSYNEGFPLVLLEAMSYNIPVLVSSIPANRQLNLPEDSYFETGNTLQLSNKIQEAIDHPTKNTYNLNDYSWSRVAKMTNEVFQKILRE